MSVVISYETAGGWVSWNSLSSTMIPVQQEFWLKKSYRREFCENKYLCLRGLWEWSWIKYWALGHPQLILLILLDRQDNIQELLWRRRNKWWPGRWVISELDSSGLFTIFWRKSSEFPSSSSIESRFFSNQLPGISPSEPRSWGDLKRYLKRTRAAGRASDADYHSSGMIVFFIRDASKKSRERNYATIKCATHLRALPQVSPTSTPASGYPITVNKSSLIRPTWRSPKVMTCGVTVRYFISIGSTSRTRMGGAPVRADGYYHMGEPHLVFERNDEVEGC